MIDGSEKRKRQLASELQNSRVFEKRSKPRFNKSFDLKISSLMVTIK